MNDELAARHRAITLRLAGRPVRAICAAVGRSAVWFHKGWRRYLGAGPEGLSDLTRARPHLPPPPRPPPGARRAPPPAPRPAPPPPRARPSLPPDRRHRHPGRAEGAGLRAAAVRADD